MLTLLSNKNKSNHCGESSIKTSDTRQRPICEPRSAALDWSDRAAAFGLADLNPRPPGLPLLGVDSDHREAAQGDIMVPAQLRGRHLSSTCGEGGFLLPPPSHKENTWSPSALE